MSIILAENGKTSCKILLEKNADRVLKFAAKELAGYLQKMTNASFPVIMEGEEEENCEILLILKAGKEVDDEIDSFELIPQGKNLIFQGVNPRSTLYAVYDFLEYAGCAFLEPEVERVPFFTKLELDLPAKKSTAAFVLRNIFREQIVPDKNAAYRGLEAGHHLPQIDFMAKRKLNHYDFYVDYCRYDLWEKYKHEVLPAMLDRGMKLEVCHHSIGYFFPADEAHDYGNYGDSTYYATHPEWFQSNQARIEIPEVREIITKRFLDYVRNNPELKMIGVWPGDSEMPAPEEGLTVADGYLDFWNKIAAELEKEFPDKYLSIIAYLDLLDAPAKRKGAKNTQIWFCPIRTNYHFSMLDRPESRHFLEQLDGWVKSMPEARVNVFDYFGWQPPFSPYARNVGRTLRRYRELKAGGAYGWVGFTYNLMGEDYRWAKELYTYTEQLWDPDADVDMLLEKWALGVFGEDAGKKIVEFYQEIEEEHNKVVARTVPDAMKPWITLPLLHKMQAKLAEARSLTNDPAVLRRIELLELVAVNSVTDRIVPEAKGSLRDPLDSL